MRVIQEPVAKIATGQVRADRRKVPRAEAKARSKHRI
jgi:hypothetical protein